MTLTYQILRDGQEFGPYSLSDVQRYVGTGNILLTDLARAEGTTEWLPVSQVVGTVAVAPPQQFAPPQGYGAMPQFPDPPNLQWGLVLLFTILTCGIFAIVWNLVQALWIKKVQPETKALQFYIIVLVLAGINLITSVVRVIWLFHGRSLGMQHDLPVLIVVSSLFSIASLVMQWIVYPFTMRSSLERHFNGPDPVGLNLSGVMTFFFGSLYFQYHLDRINDIKRAYRPQPL